MDLTQITWFRKVLLKIFYNTFNTINIKTLSKFETAIIFKYNYYYYSYFSTSDSSTIR